MNTRSTVDVNRTKSHTGSRAEHVFAVIRLKFGYIKVALESRRAGRMCANYSSNRVLLDHVSFTSPDKYFERITGGWIVIS